MKNKLLKSKKAQTDDPMDGDTGIFAGDLFYYLKIIIVIGILVVYLVIPGLRLLNSQSTIPLNLEEDIYFARLTNNCLAEAHQPFSTIDQDTINLNLFSKATINTCFEKNPLAKLSITWYGLSNNSKTTKTLVFSTLQNTLTIKKMVLVNINDTLHTGVLTAEMVQ